MSHEPGWQTKMRRFVAAVAIPVGVVLALVLVLAGYSADWTGFGQHSGREKTLWDWMTLLLVPAVIALGAWWLNKSEKENEQKVESDRQRQATLEKYFDCMTELLLKEGLRGSQSASEVRGMARTRTLAVLRVLDEDRKAQVLQFLYESDLISKDPIIPLFGANFEFAELGHATLRNADLCGTCLKGAHLDGANMKDAILRGSDLTSADLSNAVLAGCDLEQAILASATLSNANLSGANLACANLTGANLMSANLTAADLTDAILKNAKLTDGQLATASCLEYAVLPDGKRFTVVNKETP